MERTTRGKRGKKRREHEPDDPRTHFSCAVRARRGGGGRRKETPRRWHHHYLPLPARSIAREKKKKKGGKGREEEEVISDTRVTVVFASGILKIYLTMNEVKGKKKKSRPSSIGPVILRPLQAIQEGERKKKKGRTGYQKEEREKRTGRTRSLTRPSSGLPQWGHRRSTDCGEEIAPTGTTTSRGGEKKKRKRKEGGRYRPSPRSRVSTNSPVPLSSLGVGPKKESGTGAMLDPNRARLLVGKSRKREEKGEEKTREFRRLFLSFYFYRAPVCRKGGKKEEGREGQAGLTL